MNQIDKYLYIPDGVKIYEPNHNSGVTQTVLKKAIEECPNQVLTEGAFCDTRDQFIADMKKMAPDLGSNDLAQRHGEALFRKLLKYSPGNARDLILAGSLEQYNVGRFVLGPLAVDFVDTVMRNTTSGSLVFPARDATPFFYTAKALKKLNPDRYCVSEDDMHNPVFNRKLWGVEDELDPVNKVLTVVHPMVQRLLSQIGFAKDRNVTFVETGCWGTMADGLRRDLPDAQFSLHFLFSHMPDRISGFTNEFDNDLEKGVLETIADTWEAFPKPFRRPTKLVEHNGMVKASLEGFDINSQLLPIWTVAALQGVVDAALDFVSSGNRVNTAEEIKRLARLSAIARTGVFTGVLPEHTQTWSGGQDWKDDWRWGKIPPLK